MSLCLGCSNPTNYELRPCAISQRIVLSPQAKKLLVEKQAFRLVIAQTVPRRPVQSLRRKVKEPKRKQPKLEEPKRKITEQENVLCLAKKWK